MAEEQTTPEKIVEQSLKPKVVKSGDTTVEQHDPRAQIEADKYAASKAAASKTGFPIRFFKIVPPGRQ